VAVRLQATKLTAGTSMVDSAAHPSAQAERAGDADEDVSADQDP
jgi:hypothetical protein